MKTLLCTSFATVVQLPHLRRESSFVSYLGQVLYSLLWCSIIKRGKGVDDMKLNYECLRSLLLKLEEFENIDEDLNYEFMTLDDMAKALPEFPKNEIAYTTLKAEEGGLINASIMNADDCIYECGYSSLTYDGHQFLDNVRSNSIWSKTKSIAKELGCTSLRSLLSISEKIVLAVIQSRL